MSDPAMLARTANRLRTVPGFMAFELDRYRHLTNIDPADDFDLPITSLVPLGLCRRPRQDHYAADIGAIADRVGVHVTDLANFLRAVDAVTALVSRSGVTAGTDSGFGGVLAAARDHGEEHTEFEEPAGDVPTLPGWLSQAVDRFWGGQSVPSTFPRDLHLPILMNLPLAIIEIDGLTVANLDRWLRRHELPELAAIADRPLRGCLVAYAGIGVLFVDRSDDTQQHRLTLAHEAGHFLVDYLLPREDVARRRPELLEVLDGERLPSNSERFDALLADVPIGFHTHLLERDVHGGHLSSATAVVEDRAERLALELLAPLYSVLAEMDGSHGHDAKAVLRKRFGLSVGVATRYANHVRRYRPRPPQSLLEAIGMTAADEEGTGSQPADRPETDS